jgi:hypothetical protein
MDTPMLPSAMPKIRLRNGLRTRDLRWELPTSMTSPTQVFEKHLVAYNILRGTRNVITPKKADSKALHGWWKYWRQQGKQFLQGDPGKIKDHNLQKIFDLYSAGIFSGTSFEM